MNQSEHVITPPPGFQRFTLKQMFVDICAAENVTDEVYLKRARAYFSHHFPQYNKAELAAHVVTHMTAEMDFDVFVTAVRILGLDVSITAKTAVPNHPPVFNAPVLDLEVDLRFRNVLLANGIHFVGQLVALRKRDVLRMINMGAVGIAQLDAELAKYKLTYEMNTQGWVAPPQP